MKCHLWTDMRAVLKKKRQAGNRGTACSYAPRICSLTARPASLRPMCVLVLSWILLKCRRYVLNCTTHCISSAWRPPGQMSAGAWLWALHIQDMRPHWASLYQTDVLEKTGRFGSTWYSPRPRLSELEHAWCGLALNKSQSVQGCCAPFKEYFLAS